MSTHYLQKFASTAALVAGSPDRSQAQGVGVVSDEPYINKAGTAKKITHAGDNPIVGVAAGYKIARGEHQQAAASDTVVTGLATVVAVVIAPRTVTLKQLFFAASIGDQAGTPAAGSILITSQKPTAVNDVTPTAATDFTDNIKVNWVAIGT